jgi:hypothetical protein
MSITTNPAVERHGADAIHIASTPPGYRLYLGEAKTYDRKVGGLTQALGNAVTDVMQKYDSHTQELDLYTYEDFVPVELEAIARQYLAGTLPDLEVHLVCIVTYDEKSIATGTCRQTVLDSIMTTLRSTAQSACKATALQKLPEALKPRLNCILFPVQAMDNLIDAFRKELG